jgi:FkbM family methyltransferase
LRAAEDITVVAVRTLVKNILERLTGCEVVRLGCKSFAIIDRKCTEDAWFIYHTQLRSIIEKRDINLVIDAGANEGQFARKLRSFYSGEILSFEPVSSVYKKLAATASSDPNWHVHKLALGSQALTQMIHVSNSTVLSSLLTTNNYCAQRFGINATGTKEEVVSVRRLDELLAKIAPDIEGKRIFLKLDTQGYDVEAFRGMGSKIKNVVALQSEVSFIPIYEGMPHWTESITAYESAGFEMVGMFPVTWDAGRIIECDCLMVRRGFE